MRFRFAVTLVTAALTALAVTVAVNAQKGSTAASAKDSFFAAMEGKNERPRADKDGRGSFAATFEGGQLCYAYVVKNIPQPAAAHIHKGSAGKNGDVVLPLAEPKSGDPGTVSDCAEVPADLKKAILRRPATFYVNVHTQDFPGGAIRGQLFAKSP